MDMGTLTFAAGLISCIIGVSTFVVGRMNKSEHNGALEEKINQALSGIDTINAKLEKSIENHHAINLAVNTNHEQITTLFNQIEDLKADIRAANDTKEAIVELIQTLKEKQGV